MKMTIQYEEASSVFEKYVRNSMNLPDTVSVNITLRGGRSYNGKPSQGSVDVEILQANQANQETVSSVKPDQVSKKAVKEVKEVSETVFDDDFSDRMGSNSENDPLFGD